MGPLAGEPLVGWRKVADAPDRKAPVTASHFTPTKIILALLPTSTFLVLLASLNDLELTQSLYLNVSYYLMLVGVLCWAGLYVHRGRALSWNSLWRWGRENWAGLAVAVIITAVAALSIEPGLRVLSDEANLVGTSKNLFYSKSPTFTLSGKSYYGTYFSVESVIDQRPALFPFFVSLVHAALGYSYENVFYLNLLLLPGFVFLAYHIAKSLAGETSGIVTSLFVVAHPIVLISVRSGGFDFFATFFSLLVMKCLLDFVRSRAPDDFALLWMNLCLFAGIRYESALFLPPILALLLFFRLITRETLKPYALLYSLTPAFLLPRIWLSLLRGNVPKQEPGAVTFSFENFVNNVHEYFQPLLDPTGYYPAHSALLIALGLFGVGRWFWLRPDKTSTDTKKLKASPEKRFAFFVGVWMVAQVVIVFTYVWGRAQYPSAARLVLPVDVFFSFFAAWVLTRALRRLPPLTSILVGAGVFLAELPDASDNKMMSKLTETRESAALWKYFERLNKDDILVVTKRPNQFTIMNYGAMSFEAARSDSYLFTALDRRLFQEIYVVQQIQISNSKPLPGNEYWSERALQVVYEFQNEANVLTRVSRVVH